MILIRRVVGSSMVPALQSGRLVIATDWLVKVEKFDIVILEHNGIEKIKRIDEVKDGKVFVLSDNRQFGTDSRHFGWLPQTAVKAKVIWPRHYMTNPRLEATK